MSGPSFHFISGLPRSGSTLLSALLGQNPGVHASISSPLAGLAAGSRGNVYQRMELLAQHDQMVGSAWAGLREAFYGPHAAKLLVVDYDLLAQAPAKVMPLLYRFIGAPEFAHDFENAAFDAPAFDAVLGAPGLHRTRAKVEFKPRRTVLPPDLFEKYAKMSFWTDPSGSAANVIAPAPK